MKFTTILTLTLSVSALGLTGCGKKEAAAPKTAAVGETAPMPAKAAETSMAKNAPAAQSVTVVANDMMKFDVTRIEAVGGTELTITLKNTGSLPKAAMGHNLVVLKKDANASAFANAAMVSAKTEYIPEAMADQMLAHTKILGPGESDTITFTVPSAPGEYVYLCSFPAHYMAGMKGVIVVK
jgi:azurin